MILGASIVAKQQGFELNVHQLHSMFNFFWRGLEDHPHLITQKDYNIFPLKSTFLKGWWKEKFFLVGHLQGFGIQSLKCYARNTPPLVPLLDVNIPLSLKA
ncbi:hypothetical protein JCGZ_05129 [Jatropha curcas]|uniref:Uncharacterized protein n=1 Tax=Jatropha curcas TaxID=180498 RepID=A0A067KV12_JATCU|nr:hypothetical protein JCGZ_05129 [Jatropha curcas]